MTEEPVREYLRTLEMKFGTKPRFHGNGFIQLRLPGSKRLHIWTPEFKGIPEHNATIHNHRYDAESTILCGSLRHNTFDVQMDWLGEWRCWEPVSVDGKSAETLQPKWLATCVPSGEYTMTAGSHYKFPNPYFHTSNSDVFTATLFEINPDKVEHPWILAPKGERPVDAFAPEHQPSYEQMWGVILENTGEYADLLADHIWP